MNEPLADARLKEENRKLRAALVKFVDHFGPLEDNFMLHSGARACFKLARKALGPKVHDKLIRDVLSSSSKCSPHE